MTIRYSFAFQKKTDAVRFETDDAGHTKRAKFAPAPTFGHAPPPARARERTHRF